MEPNYFRHVQEEQHLEAESPLDQEEDAQMTPVSENLSREEELEIVKKKLKEIEEETGNLRQKGALIEKEIGDAAQGHENSTGASDDAQSEKEEVDSRSINVGNVDYECTPEEVQQHFQSCGTVNHVTILTDQFGQPKGFAYVEFVETEAVQNALMLNESELHGRLLKVMRKGTNIPGMRQYRGRPSFRRGFMPGQLAYGPKNVYKDPDDGRQRFLLELEFVQCLANPTYIHYLAQNRYFEDEAFIGYLKYLQYWQRPEYTKFIMYPHCLFFLELLQNLNFRNAMAHPANKWTGGRIFNTCTASAAEGALVSLGKYIVRVATKELAHRQQFYFWKNYRNNRLKHILPRHLPEPSAVPPVSAAVPPPPVPPTTLAAPPPGPGVVPSPAASALSPMLYSIPSGSALPKNDPRNSGVDRRKRKKDG